MTSTPTRTHEEALDDVNSTIDALDSLIERTREQLDCVGNADDCGEAPGDELYGILEEMQGELEVFVSQVDNIMGATVGQLDAVRGRVTEYSTARRDEISEAREALDAALSRAED